MLVSTPNGDVDISGVHFDFDDIEAIDNWQLDEQAGVNLKMLAVVSMPEKVTPLRKLRQRFENGETLRNASAFVIACSKNAIAKADR